MGDRNLARYSACWSTPNSAFGWDKYGGHDTNTYIELRARSGLENVTQKSAILGGGARKKIPKKFL